MFHEVSMVYLYHEVSIIFHKVTMVLYEVPLMFIKFPACSTYLPLYSTKSPLGFAFAQCCCEWALPDLVCVFARLLVCKGFPQY